MTRAEAPREADLPRLADTIAAEAARLPGLRYDRAYQLESARHLQDLVGDLIAGLERGYLPCPAGCPATDCLAYEHSEGSTSPCERWTGEPDPAASREAAGRGPACVLAWVPDWADCTTERGGGRWVICPNRPGIEHESLPREHGRHALAGTLAGLVEDRIGSPVAMYRRRRLSVGPWWVWPIPAWHVYPVPPAGAREHAGARRA